MNRMLFIVLSALIVNSCGQSKEKLDRVASEMPLPIELEGPKYSDIAKAGLKQLTSKDINAFVENFSENAIYRFNNGDSIAGKEAIRTYWSDRMNNVIDKLEITNDVWLPIKVNESSVVRTGDWVLSWSRVKATYMTGKSMSQWVHTVYHFNEDGKIDQVTHFLDRVPILAASSEQ